MTASSSGSSCRRLTEERRKQLAKAVGKFAEDARVSIRNIRRDANDRLKALAKDKKVSQDEERRAHDQIQKATDRFIAKVDELAEEEGAGNPRRSDVQARTAASGSFSWNVRDRLT